MALLGSRALDIEVNTAETPANDFISNRFMRKN